MKNKFKNIIIILLVIIVFWILYFYAGHLILKLINPQIFTSENINNLDGKILTFLLTSFFYYLIYQIFRFLLRKDKASDKLKILKKGSIFKFDFLIATIFYIVCTLIFFYPILRLLINYLIGPPEDNMQGLWNIWWGYRVFENGNLNFSYTNYLFYPEGTSLIYHDFSFLNYFISLLLKPIGNLVLIYNILILISFPLAGLFMFFLVKYLTKNSYASIIGGFIFAFSPYHVAHSLHHLNLAAIYFIPLFILFFLKAIKEKSKINIFGASLFFLLCALSHWNYFIFNIFFIALSYIYLAYSNKKVFISKIILRILIILGMALFILSPLILSMIILGWDNPDIQINIDGHNKHVVDIGSLLIPHSYHIFSDLDFFIDARNEFTGFIWETASYIGIIILFLLLIFFRKIVKNTAKYFAGMVSFLILASGTQIHYFGKEIPILLPYELIKNIPFLASARIPARNIVIVYLFLAIIIAFIIKYLFDNNKSYKKFILLFSIITLLIIFDYFAPIKERTNIFLPQCYDKIKDSDKDSGILNLPLDDRNLPFNYDTRFMLHQTYHELPIANGYISRENGSTLVDNLELNKFLKQKKQLADNHIKYIVVHKNFPTAKYLDIAEYKKHYQLICDDSENMIFEILADS